MHRKALLGCCDCRGEDVDTISALRFFLLRDRKMASGDLLIAKTVEGILFNIQNSKSEQQCRIPNAQGSCAPPRFDGKSCPLLQTP
jgi:hypothetical protein